jgi:hypothetical protein|nr:MAG TPA: hypothetical protein [Bacteriophage sp.]
MLKFKHNHIIIEEKQEVEIMPEYTEKQKEQRRKAVADFMRTVDRVNCQFPLGTKERIKELTGKSCNAFIKETVIKELDKIERKKLKEN